MILCDPNKSPPDDTVVAALRLFLNLHILLMKPEVKQVTKEKIPQHGKMKKSSA